MTIIKIAVLSERYNSRNIASELEDDFYFNFGDDIYPSIRTFTLNDLDQDYLDTSVIVSVYDDNSIGLYKYMIDKGYRQTAIDAEEQFGYISLRILREHFGVIMKSKGVIWKPEKFEYFEEGHFKLGSYDSNPYIPFWWQSYL